MSPFAVDYANLPIVEPTSSSPIAAPTGAKSGSGPSFLDFIRQADRSSRGTDDHAAQAGRRNGEPTGVGDTPRPSERAKESARTEQPAESKRGRPAERQTDGSVQDGSRAARQDGSDDEEEASDDSEAAAAAAIAGVRQDAHRDPASAAEDVAEEAKLDETQALKSALQKAKRRADKATGTGDGKATPDAAGATNATNTNTPDAAATTAEPIVAAGDLVKTAVDETTVTAAETGVGVTDNAATSNNATTRAAVADSVDGVAVKAVVDVESKQSSSTTESLSQVVGEAAKQAAASNAAGTDLKQATTASKTTTATDAVPVEAKATSSAESAATDVVAADDLRRNATKEEKQDRRGDDLADSSVASADVVAAPPTVDAALAATAVALPTTTVAIADTSNATTSSDRGSDGVATAVDARRDPPPPDAPRSHARFDTLGAQRATSTDGGSSLSQADRVRLVQRVARAVQTAQERGGELKLRLSPPELGSLRLEVQFKDGTLSARIETQTPEAKQVLVENLPALRERLSEQNIRVERFDVDLSNSGSHGGSPQSFEGGSDSSPRGAPRSANEVRREVESPRADRAVEHGPASAVDGRLNILI